MGTAIYRQDSSHGMVHVRRIKNIAETSSHYSLDAMSSWVQPSTTYTSSSLSVAKKSDGSLIICNVDSGVVYESECSDVKTLISGNDTAINWVSTGIVAVDIRYSFATVWNLESELFMTFTDRGAYGVGPAKTQIYKSPSGLGGDWILYSTVHSLDWPGTETWGSDCQNITGIPIKLSTGRWVICTMYWANYASRLEGRAALFTSDDNGVTWTYRFYYDVGFATGTYYANIMKSIVIDTNGALYSGLVSAYGGYAVRLFKSIDNGVTWTSVYNVGSGFFLGYKDDYTFVSAGIFQIGSTFLLYVAGTGSTQKGVYLNISPDTNISTFVKANYLPALSGVTTIYSTIIDNNILVVLNDNILLISLTFFKPIRMIKYLTDSNEFRRINL